MSTPDNVRDIEFRKILTEEFYKVGALGELPIDSIERIEAFCHSQVQEARREFAEELKKNISVLHGVQMNNSIYLHKIDEALNLLKSD